jgi:hypothetical protein
MARLEGDNDEEQNTCQLSPKDVQVPLCNRKSSAPMFASSGSLSHTEAIPVR